MKSIQVFEHQTLAIGEQGFGQNHYDSLQKYNGLHQKKYFIFLQSNDTSNDTSNDNMKRYEKHSGF